MRHTNKNERDEQCVENWRAWQEHQDALGIGRQPNVIAAHQQLKRDFAKPTEHEAAFVSQKLNRITKYYERQNLNKQILLK